MQDSPSANWRALIVGLFLALAVFGIAIGTRGCIQENPGPIGSAGLETDRYLDMRDPQTLKRVERARAELGAFTERFGHPRSGDREFRVRARFASVDSVDHLWVGGLKKTEAGFEGTLLEEPPSIRTLHRGMPVQVESANIVDWYVLSADGPIGGYTLSGSR